MPVYSFGKESPLKIHVSDKDADAYNRVTKEFFEAQFRFMEETHTEYTGREPLKMDVAKKDMKRYHRVVRHINFVIKRAKTPFQESDLPEDFLVKN